MKQNKEDITKMFKLPSYVKGKSFADASKLIQKRFEDRDDKISRDTMNVLLDRLRQAQEYVNAKEGNPTIDQQQNQMFLGGALSGLISGGGIGGALGQSTQAAQAAQSAQSALPVVGDLLQSGQQIFGKSNIDNSGKVDTSNMKMPKAGLNAASQAAQGFMQGSQVAGPIGGAVMAAVKGIGGFMGAKKDAEAITEGATNFALGQNAQMTDNYGAYGGKIDPTDPPKGVVKDTIRKTVGPLLSMQNLFATGNLKSEYERAIDTTGLSKNKPLSYSDVNLGNNNSSVDDRHYYEYPKGSSAYNSLEKKLDPNSKEYKELQKKYAVMNAGKGASRTTGPIHSSKIDPEDPKKPKKPNEGKYGGKVNKYAPGGNMQKDPPDWWEEGADLTPGTDPIYSVADGLTNPTFNVPAKTMLGAYGNDVFNKMGTPNQFELMKENQTGFEQTNISNLNLGGDKPLMSPGNNESLGSMQQTYGTGESTDPLKERKPSQKWMTDIARYAPAMANLYQYLNAEKPDHVRLDRIDQRYKPQQVDEQALQNIATQNFGNMRNALVNTAGGSQAGLQSNLIAASAAQLQGQSDAYLKAKDANMKDAQFGQRFNQMNNMANLRQSNLEQDINAQNEGAYNSDRSKFLTATAENIGGVATEMSRDQDIKQMLDYLRSGKYVGNGSDTAEAKYGGSLDDVYAITKDIYMKRMKKNG